MPKRPDFDHIAWKIAIEAPGVNGEFYRALASDIAEQLRLIWNARGAADLVKLEAELSTLMGATASGPYTKNLDRALRSLDVDNADRPDLDDR